MHALIDGSSPAPGRLYAALPLHEEPGRAPRRTLFEAARLENMTSLHRFRNEKAVAQILGLRRWQTTTTWPTTTTKNR